MPRLRSRNRQAEEVFVTERDEHARDVGGQVLGRQVDDIGREGDDARPGKDHFVDRIESRCLAVGAVRAEDIRPRSSSSTRWWPAPFGVDDVVPEELAVREDHGGACVQLRVCCVTRDWILAGKATSANGSSGSSVVLSTTGHA